MHSSALLALALLTGAPDVDLKKRAEQLVLQLGDKDYRDREKAAKELLQMGYAAKEAVLAGQKNPDGEIAERCKKLYPAIFRHDLEKRVQKFLDNPDGLVPEDLPGATRWLKIAGDGKESRELYADMVKGHPDILLDAELNPSRIPQITADLMRSVYGRVTRPIDGAVARQGPTSSEVLLYFFLSAAGDVRKGVLPGVSSSHYYQFFTAAFTATTLKSSASFRKLFAAALEKERYPLVLRRSLDVATQNAVKECAPIAIKLAGEAGIPVIYRASGLIAFGKLASKEQIKDLEPFLKDETVVSPVVVVNKDRGSVQMRDVALGMAIQMVGEDLTEFGFLRRPTTTITAYTAYAFASDEKRDAAHAKWKEWAAKNLKK